MNKKFTIIIPLIMLFLMFYAPTANVFAATVPSDSQQKLDKIGKWDGVAEKSELQGAYAEPAQQNVPYARRSFYLTPWRGYMDTWDAGKYLKAMGVVFNVDKEEAEASAKILNEAGFRSARVELGWDTLDFDDETKCLFEAIVMTTPQ